MSKFVNSTIKAFGIGLMLLIATIYGLKLFDWSSKEFFSEPDEKAKVIVAKTSGYNSTTSLNNNVEEAKYIDAIMKTYPTSDERCQFVTATRKAFAILEECLEKFEAKFTSVPETELAISEDGFLPIHMLPIYKPFLKSHNEDIRVCAEDGVRFVRSWIYFFLLIEPLDNASDEEVELALENSKKAAAQFKISYSDFLRNSIPRE